MRAVWRALGIGVLTTALLPGGAAHHEADAQTLFQLVQVGPEGTSVVRAITDNACPKVRFDSGKIATNVRSEINQKFDGEVQVPFPVRVCEVPVPAGSITGTLEEKVLPIARPNPRRIVVRRQRLPRGERRKNSELQKSRRMAVRTYRGCRSSRAPRPGHSRRRLRVPRVPLSCERGGQVWRQPGTL